MVATGLSNMSVNVREALKKGIHILKSAHIEAPVIDAGVVLCHVLKKDKTFLYSHPEHMLKDEEYRKYMELIGKRAKGMPVPYLTGRREFMSLDFVVNQDVLIPRQDTEILVETVLEYARERSKPRTDRQAGRQADKQAGREGDGRLSILDMGTGSGCIAVSLAYYLEGCRVTAVDISEKALEVARINASMNGVADLVAFIKSDLFTELWKGESQCRFDIIASNPPYVPAEDLKHLQREVRDYEPLSALNGGEDGLDFYRAIIKESVDFLKPDGLLAFEVGINQAPYVCALMKERFYNIRTVKDLSGIERVVAGTLRP